MERTRVRRRAMGRGGTRGCGYGLRRTVLLLAGAVALAAAPGARAQVPAAEGERLVVIQAAKVITNTGADVERGMIVLADGKIRNVGRGLEFPANARVIDASDRVVMPGLINPATRIGLPNYNRGEVHANWTAADEWLPGPGEYEELLDAGYTAIALHPAGAGIPGRALVIRTAGPRAQQVLQSPAYVRVTPDKKLLRGALEKAQAEIEKVDKARAEFEKQQQAQSKPAAEGQPAASQPAGNAAPAATQPAFQPPPIEPAVQPLVELLQKQAGVFALLELTCASDYLHYQDVLKKFPIAHQYLARLNWESDLALVAEQLGADHAHVVLWPVVTRVPDTVERLHVPRLLAEAGCKVSLLPVADSGWEHRRMLGRVGGLVRDGWTRKDALLAVTLHPAQLLGLDGRFGTLEAGKEADLIFLDADPLDPRARVREVLIAGEVVHRAAVDERAARAEERP